MARIAYRNFTGGEVTPTLSARYDLQKFGSFLSCCRNFIPNLHGDVERRPGTKFIADLGSDSFLVPFAFNTDASENYVLVFQSGTIRVAQADGLLSASMSNPYSMGHVPQLSVFQTGDVLYLAHERYALRKVTRSGSSPYTWSISTVNINDTLSAPGAPTVSWHRGPKNDDSSEAFTKNESYKLRYVVTAVDSDGVESLASSEGSVTGRYPTDWVSGDYVSLTWPTVSGAKEYNVYRESAGYYGLVGVSSRTKTVDATTTVTGVKLNNVPMTKGSGWALNVNTSYDYDDSSSTTTYTMKKVGGAVCYYDNSSKVMIVRGLAYGTTLNSNWYIVSGVTTSGGDSTLVSSSQVSHLSNSGETYPTGAAGGYVVTPVTVSTGGYVAGYFTDENFEPDAKQTPPVEWKPFASDNNPSNVCMHQQRLVLAGTRKNTATVYASRTGDFENFRKHRPLQDDDPLEYMIASGSIDDIRWAVSFGGLLLGTSGAEYEMNASGASLTPKDCQVKTQSFWGSSRLAPIVIGTSVLHCQRAGSHVRDLYYSWENDGYQGTDLSLLAPHLVEGKTLRQWSFQQTPGSCVWIVRSDGVLLCLTYLKDQKVFAWSRHVTYGSVVSATTISGGDEDVLMLVVKRKVNGAYRFYLERMVSRWGDSTAISDAWFVDCGVKFTNAPGVKVESVSGLSHLAGRTVAVLADGSPEEHVVSADGKVVLDYPANTIVVGLPYTSVLSPLPMETDTQQGSTLGKRRAYGRTVLRLHRSVGGKYGATGLGDLFDVDGWKGRELYDIPFLPEMYGAPCVPFSGDVEVDVPSGQDPDTSLWIVQDRPLPFRVVSMSVDVDLAEV